MRQPEIYREDIDPSYKVSDWRNGSIHLYQRLEYVYVAAACYGIRGNAYGPDWYQYAEQR